MIIAVDFDGTCVEHLYPVVGPDVPGAVVVMRRLVSNGHKIILYTMRSGQTLLDAVRWFRNNGIPLFGVNTNPEQKLWTASPKAYAHMYVDDLAVGCPIIPASRSRSAMVDWMAVETAMISRLDQGKPTNVRVITVLGDQPVTLDDIDQLCNEQFFELCWSLSLTDTRTIQFLMEVDAKPGVIAAFRKQNREKLAKLTYWRP